jgi:hypothetical protein
MLQLAYDICVWNGTQYVKRVPNLSVRTSVQTHCMFGVYYNFDLNMNEWGGLP